MEVENLIGVVCFNTQPPEGGWVANFTSATHS